MNIISAVFHCSTYFVENKILQNIFTYNNIFTNIISVKTLRMKT